MSEELKKLIIEEFSSPNAQAMYLKKGVEGLWASEEYFISRYFPQKNTALLDVGCGTGRTTLPLYQRGYKIIGVDIVPAMIMNARKLAQEKSQNIDYRVGDATQLEFFDNSFDYVLFSNQGWEQIPGKENRLKAMREIHRVLKPGGVFIFTIHNRDIFKGRFWVWVGRWIKVSLLKPLGVKMPEQDFGDILFERPSSQPGLPPTRQFIHITSTGEAQENLTKAGFRVLEINLNAPGLSEDQRKFPPVFCVGQKPE